MVKQFKINVINNIYEIKFSLMKCTQVLNLDLITPQSDNTKDKLRSRKIYFSQEKNVRVFLGKMKYISVF